jgi:hypothetical protein
VRKPNRPGAVIVPVMMTLELASATAKTPLPVAMHDARI